MRQRDQRGGRGVCNDARPRSAGGARGALAAGAQPGTGAGTAPPGLPAANCVWLAQGVYCGAFERTGISGAALSAVCARLRVCLSGRLLPTGLCPRSRRPSWRPHSACPIWCSGDAACTVFATLSYNGSGATAAPAQGASEPRQVPCLLHGAAGWLASAPARRPVLMARCAVARAEANQALSDHRRRTRAARGERIEHGAPGPPRLGTKPARCRSDNCGTTGRRPATTWRCPPVRFALAQ